MLIQVAPEVRALVETHLGRRSDEYTCQPVQWSDRFFWAPLGTDEVGGALTTQLFQHDRHLFRRDGDGLSAGGSWSTGEVPTPAVGRVEQKGVASVPGDDQGVLRKSPGRLQACAIVDEGRGSLKSRGRQQERWD